MSEPFQRLATAIGGVFILLCGIFACDWPLRFLRISSPRLRQIKSDEIDRDSMTKIEYWFPAAGAFCSC